MSDVVGRYAPSPSSWLHLGNLRTALLAWLAAHAAGGVCRLRVDDLDSARSSRAVAEQQIADLRALGLRFAGPVTWQSERLQHYLAAFKALRDADAVYPCWCSRKDIADAVRAPHDRGGYPGTCRDLTPAEQQVRRARASRPPSWRLRAGAEPVAFDDLVLGPLWVAGDDVVLRRFDGEFGYQLAVVVDDALDGVTQVVRGADLIDSVAAQTRVRELLGLAGVSYGHVPLVLGPDGVRLSKRHAGTGLADVLDGTCPLRLPGIEPGAKTTAAQVVSSLAATAGIAEPGEQVTLDELVDRFSFGALPSEPTALQPV